MSDVARDWDLRGDELATAAIAAGEPTAWFDQLYAEGEQGAVSMPWNRDAPYPLLREWADAGELVGQGRTAIVVGCGLGADAEYLARLGYVTTAFDIAPTAVRLAAERNPGSAVDYRVADLLDLPPQWDGAFDLVVEIFTVQALPDPPRSAAIRAISALLAPGGTLLAVAFRPTEGADPADGPPFSLTRDVMEQFAVDDVRVQRVEELGDRWRIEYRRAGSAGSGS
ncbi:class I SAM-dependent methyltransferase [Angustibacter luteus]|uniref:Class I SAM-dependent methyltransferase n=1 Tax=Angustibacter luteus TaxID=658456 RepID=A0ABW1JAI5_9ACTN